MLRTFGLAIYRGFFWTSERGTWQYDLMVIAILSFIFLTPRGWFHDRPPSASSSRSDVVLLRNENTVKIYQLQAALVDGQNQATVQQGIGRVLRDFTGKSLVITRIEPARDSNGQVVSYAVWVHEND